MTTKDANIGAARGQQEALDAALVEEVQNVLLGGLTQFEGSGMRNIKNIPPPTPAQLAAMTPAEQEAALEVPTVLAAQSIAIGIVKAMTDQIKDTVLDILSRCTVTVTDSTGAELTGTITYPADNA